MLRYLTNKKRNQRREKNHDAVKDIYRRGASTIASDKLVVHQVADSAAKMRVLAAADERRKRRLARAIGAGVN